MALEEREYHYSKDKDKGRARAWAEVPDFWNEDQGRTDAIEHFGEGRDTDHMSLVTIGKMHLTNPKTFRKLTEERPDPEPGCSRKDGVPQRITLYFYPAQLLRREDTEFECEVEGHEMRKFHITGRENYWVADEKRQQISAGYHLVEFLPLESDQEVVVLAKQGACKAILNPVVKDGQIVFAPSGDRSEVWFHKIKWDKNLGGLVGESGTLNCLLNRQGQRISGEYDNFEKDEHGDIWGISLSRVMGGKPVRERVIINSDWQEPDGLLGNGS